MEKTKLYNGKTTLYFDEANHIYSLDEKQEKIIPGVTSVAAMVAKPALVQWAVNCALNVHADGKLEGEELVQAMRFAHRAESVKAATNGTKAHKWIEQYIKGEKQDTPENPEIMASCFAFLNWLREAKPEFIMSERKILSKEHGYAGTLDFTAKIDITEQGKKLDVEHEMLVLGDFKTSKAIYPEYFMETAARIKALEEEFPDVKYDAMMIVRVGKDGKHEVKVETDIDKYFKAFLGALELYKCFKS